MKRSIAIAVAATVLLAPAAALAHHSYSMFDTTKEVEFKDATVKEWQWTNPHTWLYLYVPNGTASPDKVSIEGNNPGVLRRSGYGIATFKPGDKVTVYARPLLNGEKGGALLAVTLPDGRMLGQRLQKPVQ